MRKLKTNEAFVFILLTNYSVISQVKGRFVHQPIDCSTANVPRCSSLTSDSCQIHCVNLGFTNGSCDSNGDCCVCFPDRPPPTSSEQINPNQVSTRSDEIELRKTEKQSEVPQPECQNNNEIDQICLTPGCVTAAASLLSKMNPKADPCDNFYEFACGGFVEKTTISDDQTEIHPLQIIGEKIVHQVRALVEAPSPADEPKPFMLAKRLYHSCNNIHAIESNGLNPVKEILVKLGGWPILEEPTKWNPLNWDWLSSIYKFRQFGFSTDYFMRFSIVPDLKNTSRKLITIDEPSLSIGREQFMTEPFVRAYHKYQVDLAILLGADPQVAQKEMGEVFEFERKLANISVPRELRRDATKFYNPTSLSDLQKQFPSIPWVVYLQRILPATVKVRHGEIIILSAPSHLTSLLQLLETTDKRILANYVMWRAAAASVRYSNSQARGLEFKFASQISGLRQLPPRWKECVGVVSSSLPHVISALYVRRHFQENARDAAVEMVNDIRQSFLDSLKNIDWMDEETKSLAWEKASAMSSHIGFPQELLDDQIIIDMYKDLDFNSENYLDNVLAITVTATNFGMGKLREVNDKSDWKAYGKVALANAFYSPIQNSIQFPAGILQENFFSHDRPKYMNYGAIGWVIGHEIIHGFDDQGRKFDHVGNLKEWWDPFTRESYVNKTMCIVEQYGKYTFNDPLSRRVIPLNGVISQGENIADNGGIKQAYKGYQAWVKRNGQEKKLPGLPYNQDQLFWISAATNWCGKQRPEVTMQKIFSAPHLPGEFRVRGTFANMEQFSKHFNCPVKSNMNPENKCTVW